jgi:probable rRNA maturation factor
MIAKIMIDLLIDEGVDEEPLPSTTAVQQAVIAACRTAGLDADEPQLCIRFAADAEVHALNARWRNKDKVTDVLSFPQQEAPDFDATFPLGDIVLAMPFVIREAERLGLPAADHILHLIVHGTLHLLGHDHIMDADAARMHPLERAIMRELGLHDPYPDEVNETDD